MWKLDVLIIFVGEAKKLFILHMEKKLLRVLEYVFFQCRKTILLNWNFLFFPKKKFYFRSQYKSCIVYKQSPVLCCSSFRSLFFSRKHSATEIPLKRFPFPKKASSWGLCCMALKKYVLFSGVALKKRLKVQTVAVKVFLVISLKPELHKPSG